MVFLLFVYLWVFFFLQFDKKKKGGRGGRPLKLPTIIYIYFSSNFLGLSKLHDLSYLILWS